jgi:uncharacterized protein DUF3592/uncharacterized protein DUF6804
VGQVFISGYSWWRLDAGWIVGIFFIGPAILFNPVVPFAFSKDTWAIIDLSTAAGFVLFGLAYLPLAAPIFWGAVLCLIGVLLVGNAAKDLLSAVRLTSGGLHTTGEIIDIEEQIEECDACAGHIRRTYDVTYRFRTESVQAIQNQTNVGYDPSEDGNSVGVDYNPSNPSESRLANARQSTIKGAVGLGIIQVAAAVFLAWLGITWIREKVKEVKAAEGKGSISEA